MIDGLVSVVMPCFNTARYAAEAAASILSQTHRNLELIAIDDGSVDGTVDVLSSIDDPRLRIIRNSKNFGIVESLNIGFGEARGEFIARMDADDIALPSRLERQISWLRAQSHFTAVGTGVSYIDESGISLRSPRLPPLSVTSLRWRLLLGNCVHHPTVMFRRHGIVLPMYSAAFPDIEDYELWLRLAATGKLANIPERLLKMRRHAASVSGLRHHAQLDAAATLLASHIASNYGLSLTQAEYRAVLEPSWWLRGCSGGASCPPGEATPVALVRRMRAAFIAKSPEVSREDLASIGDDQAFFAGKCVFEALGTREYSATRRIRLGLSAAGVLLGLPVSAGRAFRQDRSRH